MKLLPLILFLLAGCVTAEVQSPKAKVQSAPDARPPMPPGLTVSWEYPSGTDILGFHLYATPELKPLPWPLYATIAPELRAFTVTNDEPQRFFALTAFNAAGESDYATTDR